MYKTGNELINLLKQTQSMAKIEDDAAAAANAQYSFVDEAVGIDAEEGLGVETEGFANIQSTVDASFKVDDYKHAVLSGDDTAILNSFVNSN